MKTTVYARCEKKQHDKTNIKFARAFNVVYLACCLVSSSMVLHTDLHTCADVCFISSLLCFCAGCMHPFTFLFFFRMFFSISCFTSFEDDKRRSTMAASATHHPLGLSSAGGMQAKLTTNKQHMFKPKREPSGHSTARTRAAKCVGRSR